MPSTIDDLLTAFFNELQQTSERYSPFIKQAEEAGQPQLAKLYRAVVTSEIARGKLFRTGLASHASRANEPPAYFVCPQCGLIMIPEAPDEYPVDKCPVDETPGNQFEKIS